MNNYTPEQCCSKCGNSYPLTSEYWHKDKTSKTGFAYACKSCACARARQWNSDNREYVREKSREYYAENKERIQEYRKRNAEHIANQKRQWRSNNPELVRKHKRDSQRRNRASANARARRYAHRHPEQIRIRTRIAQNQRRHAPGKFTQEDVALQFEMQKHRCWWCGKKLGDTYHIDHLIPLARGGTNNPENIVISCPFCNISRRDKLPHEWCDRLL